MLQSNIISNINRTIKSSVAGIGSGGGGPVANSYAQFNGSSDYATIQAISHAGAAGTYMMRLKLDVATPVDLAKTGFSEWTAHTVGSYYTYLDGLIYLSTFRVDRVESIAPSGLVPRNSWHWVIIRDDAANGWEALQSLDDGVLRSISTQAHQAWDASPTSRFIAVNYEGRRFSGAIDRLLIGNSRWDDAQIQSVIAGGNGPDALVRFEFEEIFSNHFLDSSGNAKDALIEGSPTIEIE